MGDDVVETDGMLDYDKLERAYADAKFGTEEPTGGIIFGPTMMAHIVRVCAPELSRDEVVAQVRKFYPEWMP